MKPSRTLALQALVVVIALSASGTTSATPAEAAVYDYCYSWPLGPGQTCRNPNHEIASYNIGHSYGFSRRQCVNLQYWNGSSFVNYYPWTCSDSTYAVQSYPNVPGYTVVRNGSSSGGTVSFYGRIETAP